MSTGVKDDDAALGHLLDGGMHAGEMKALGLRQKLRVGFLWGRSCWRRFDDGSPMLERRSIQVVLRGEVGTWTGKGWLR